MRFYEFIHSRPTANLQLTDELIFLSDGKTSKATVDAMMKKFITSGGGYAVSGPQGATGPQGPVGPNGKSYTYLQDTIPAGATTGQTWLDTRDMTEWIYFNDGDSSAWVQSSGFAIGPKGDKGDKGDDGSISPATLAAGLATKVSKAGDTMTGNLSISGAGVSLQAVVRATDAASVGQIRIGGGTSSRIYLDDNAGVVRHMLYADANTTVFYGGNFIEPYWTTNRTTKVLTLGNLAAGTTVIVPTPIAATSPTTKTYVDTADALKVSKTGDTITGTVTISNTFPVLSLVDSDQAVNTQRVDVMSNAGFFKIRTTNDVGVPITEFITFDRTTLQLNLGANTSVVVPTPTAATHATTKGYVDTADATKVSKAGDTMTGTLTTTAAFPIHSLNSTDAAAGVGIVEFRDNGVLRTRIQRANSNGELSIVQYSAAGAFVRSALVLNASGVADFGGSAQVKVPAPTAATHAAQVTAIDAATGRLAIGGVEIGDTGWRNINTIWDAAVTAAGGGLSRSTDNILLRRVGSRCTLTIRDGFQWSITANRAFTLLGIGGFGSSGGNGAKRSVGVFERNTPALLAVGRINDYSTVGTVSLTFITAAANATNTTMTVEWDTLEAWPTTLPGTAA